MTKSQLLEKLAERSALTKQQASAALDCLVDIVVEHVRQGEPVKIPGLGTFKKRETKAHPRGVGRDRQR